MSCRNCRANPDPDGKPCIHCRYEPGDRPKRVDKEAVRLRAILCVDVKEWKTKPSPEREMDNRMTRAILLS